MNLTYPPAADPRPVRRLSEACEQGGSSLFTSGIDPGFGGDALPMAALQVCERVESIRIQEISDYGAHADASWLAALWVWTVRRRSRADSGSRGVPTYFWGGMVRMLADILAVELRDSKSFVNGGTHPRVSTCRSDA